jgi:Flp pilus assembly protein TadD
MEVKATLELPPETLPNSLVTELLEQGLQLMDRNRTAEALEVLRRAAYLEPDSALTQFLLAQVWQRSAQPVRALAALRQSRAALARLNPEEVLVAGFSVPDLRRAVRALSVMLGES